MGNDRVSKDNIRTSLPRVVKVAGINYPLQWVNGLKSLKNDSIGCWSRATGIEIDTVLLENVDAGAIIANVLLHELMHAATYHYSASKNQTKEVENNFCEEDMCEIVGNGLQQIFRDNPKLVKWLAAYA